MSYAYFTEVAAQLAGLLCGIDFWKKLFPGTFCRDTLRLHQTWSLKMDDSAMLLWGLLFGSIGSGYMIYGKKQQHLWAFVSGLGLCVIPYVTTSTAAMIPGAAALLAVPFLLR